MRTSAIWHAYFFLYGATEYGEHPDAHAPFGHFFDLYYEHAPTLPDDVFTLLDNLVVFTFRNEDELKQLARTGLIDHKSILTLRHLNQRQCIAVGGITSNYPLFLEVNPQEGVVMGGETRKLIS